MNKSEIEKGISRRERVLKTLAHEPVDRVPRDIWALPGIKMNRADDYEKLLKLYPVDIAAPIFNYGTGEKQSGTPYEIGKYVDAWGCVWHVSERGTIGEVKEPPISDLSKLGKFKPPYETIRNADLRLVNKCCAECDCFILAGSLVRPFERLQFLRGSEVAFIDLAYGSREIFDLIRMLHEFFMGDLKMWAKTDVDGVSMMDDWGSQTSLLISPEMWRDIFKPLYKEYCDLLHANGKYAFFHTDGEVSKIFGELIEVGFDAINSQLFCMDLENLAEKFAGKVTFWGEIDRQHILPYGTPDEVRNAVRRVRKALDNGMGGIIAEAEFGLDVPIENITAVFDEWSKPRII